MEYFPAKNKILSRFFRKIFHYNLLSNFDLRSKYKIYERWSREVSNYRFFGVLISFRGPFLTIDDPEGIWPPNINDLRRFKYNINENMSCEVSNHRFLGVLNPVLGSGCSNCFWLLKYEWPPAVKILNQLKWGMLGIKS